MKPILITGAAGRHGGTGGLIVSWLLEQGATVRAMVRVRDGRAERLAEAGAEVAVADYDELGSLRAALDGVETAYFCYPVAAGIVPAAANFAQAAREKGVVRIVHMSMGPARPEAPTRLGRHQWLAERVLDWAGLDCVHLRPGFFYENIELLGGEAYRQRGEIRNSFGEAKAVWIAGRDAAAVAFELLLQPRPELGRTPFVPGRERISFGEVAEISRCVLGRPLRYTVIDDERWVEELGANPRVSEEMARHVVGVARMVRAGGSPPVGDIVRDVTGKDPMDLRAFLASQVGEKT
jgi:uncharacterized protein YbjT (DUF2867 family)